MKNIIKLTKFNGFDQPTTPILIGTQSIIIAESWTYVNRENPIHKGKKQVITEIKVPGAMVAYIKVLESIDEIYALAL